MIKKGYIAMLVILILSVLFMCKVCKPNQSFYQTVKNNTTVTVETKTDTAATVKTTVNIIPVY